MIVGRQLLVGKTEVATFEDDARTKLVNAVRRVWASAGVKQNIEALKRNAIAFERSDYVWHSILVSFSTMGRSGGYKGLVQNETQLQ